MTDKKPKNKLNIADEKGVASLGGVITDLSFSYHPI
jgi:hypothetical protein